MSQSDNILVFVRRFRQLGAAIVLLGAALGFCRSALAAGPGEAAKKFGTLRATFDEMNSRLGKLDEKIPKAPEAEKAVLIAEIEALAKKLDAMLPEIFAAAKAAYVESPNTDPKVMEMVAGNVAYALSRDDYEQAAKISGLLLENKCPIKGIRELAGMAAFGQDQFDEASKHFSAAAEAGALTRTGVAQSGAAETYKKLWAREKELRAKEAKADDLPRVRLETSKGPIVVELFENEAPQTVGNFISLVEARFYDGLPFHRVLPNFMAQGGCPKGDGSGGPGYEIYCECGKPDHRDHFRGTLSMAHAGKDTGGSQFFLTFLPTPHLNGKHTAFGRVIEGLDVLTALARIDPNDPDPTVKPDRILKATVVRKREHKYEPTKVK